MRRFAIVLSALVVLVGGALLFVATFDWSTARSAIERAFAARTGRALSIGGALAVHAWPPSVVADDVRIANPPWAKRPDLLYAQRVALVPSLSGLLRGRLAVGELSLVEPVISLEVRDDARTWAMESDGQPQAKASLERIRIDHGRIEFLDQGSDTAIVADVSLQADGGKQGVSVRGKGRLHGEPLEFEASGPEVLPVADASLPIAIRGRLRAGATQVRVKGVVTGVPTPSFANVELYIAGENLIALRRLFDLSVPSTPPYRIEGRLYRDEAGWRLDDIRARVGDSHLEGRLMISEHPRARATGSIVAEELDFDDLGPLIGAPPRTVAGESASAAQRRQAQRLEEKERVLPAQPLDREHLRRIDVDLTFKAKRVWHPPGLPVESLSTRVHLEEGQLRLAPLQMQLAGGEVSGAVELDATHEPIRGSVALDLNALRLDRLFPQVDAMKRAEGTAHGKIDVNAKGDSISALLASASGRITLAVDRGRISNLALEMLGLDAGEMLLLFASGDRSVELQCAVADLRLRGGVATPEVLVLDTADTIVVGSGTISLADERFDLTLLPEPKDQSILAARAPLHVEGPFRKPRIAPDAGSLAARGAGAVLLGLVNPLLAIASFIETGPGKDSDCARLIAQAQSSGKKSGR